MDSNFYRGLVAFAVDFPGDYDRDGGAVAGAVLVGAIHDEGWAVGAGVGKRRVADGADVVARTRPTPQMR